MSWNARHRRLVFGIAAVAAVLHLRFLLGSEQQEVLTAWLPDDAFYYLLPAWNAAQGEGFSFDGLAPTYGFQPLWTLLLAGLAALTPTKAALIDATLVTGVALHAATGVLLARWCAAVGQSRAGVVASFLWLVNPPLLVLSASGMESGLAVALLLAVLLRVEHVEHREGRGWGLGALVGLLFLARVSLLPGLLLLLGWMTWRRRWGAPLAAVLVATPWLVFATLRFGQPLPVTMDQKLVGAWAGLARFVADWPGVPDGPLRALLPASERVLFDSPALVVPTWGSLWTLGVRAPVGWAGGAFLPRSVGPIDGLLAVAVAAVLVVLLTRGVERWQVPRSLLFLGALAALHAGANNLLLPLYVKYSYWYRVPELVLLVLVAALLLDRAVGSGRDAAGRVAVGALTVVALVGVGRALVAWQPRPWDAGADRYSNGILSIAAEVERAVPPGERVGCWNAGLLGWTVEGRPVVNLDGLANTREFARTVARREMRARMGSGEAPVTHAWLREQGIHWVVDIHPVDAVGTAPFYDVLPVGTYRGVARSPTLTHWAFEAPRHAVMLVRVE